jgi:hypothetical protein
MVKAETEVSGEPWNERTSTEGNGMIDTYGERERRTMKVIQSDETEEKEADGLNLSNRSGSEDEFLLCFCLLPEIQYTR